MKSLALTLRRMLLCYFTNWAFQDLFADTLHREGFHLVAMTPVELSWVEDIDLDRLLGAFLLVL
eukprot:m.449654 g.449654  ORF g.449654 m.449654 type:complete len:64 (-) comp56901_c0_seq16:803-994(-)